VAVVPLPAAKQLAFGAIVFPVLNGFAASPGSTEM
jgi:hypothetical protein